MVTFSSDTNPDIDIARALGHGRPHVLQPHPLRRRRGLRARSSRPPWRWHRESRTWWCATGRSTSARGTASVRACRAAPPCRPQRTPHMAMYMPVGLLTPAQWVAMAAQRYLHVTGATSEDLGRVAVADRKHAATNPAAWFYGKPITLRRPPGQPMDRRAAAPARLLPGDRRRSGPGGDVAGAGTGPAPSPGGGPGGRAGLGRRART